MKRLPKNHFIDLDGLGFVYKKANAEEVQMAYARINEKLRTVKAKPKAVEWNDYWKEMAEAKAQHPSFFKKTESGPSLFRYNGGFIVSEEKDLAVHVLHQIIGNVIGRLKGVKNIVEFGCGNGHNLEYLKKKFPAYNLFGCDISEWAVKTVQKKGFKACQFDMASPVSNAVIPQGNETVYFTSGAMEQVGTQWKDFFKFLRQSGVHYVFHVEPIGELYAKNKQEQLALQFHTIKGYLSGYFPFLKTQKDFIVEYSKSDFGTLFDQGFNVVMLTRI